MASTDVLLERQRFYYLISMVALAGFLVLLGYETYGSYRDEMRVAENNAANLGRVLDAQVRAKVEKVDVALQSVVRAYPRGLPAPDAAGEVNRTLRQVLDSIPESQSLRIVDASGNFVFDANGKSPTTNVADRAYFIRNRDDPAAGLVISEPLFARNTHNWVQTFSRRLNGPDGKFAGLVQAALPSDDLAQAFVSLGVGKDAIVGLYDRHLRLAAQYPLDLSRMGKELALESLAEKLRAGNRSGVIEANEGVDGKSRVYVFHAADRLPYVTLIALSKDELHRAWLRKGALFGGAMLLLAAVMLVLFRRWNRSHLDAVEQAEAMHQAFDDHVRHTLALLNSLPDPAWLKDKEGRFLAVNEAYLEMVQKTESEVLGNTVFDIWPTHVAQAFTDQDGIVAATYAKHESDAEVTRPDGSFRCYHYVRTPVLDQQGDLVGIAGLARDMTQSRLSENRIQQLATFDSLTNLPNRHQLNERLSDAIAQAMQSHTKVALLVLDIDHFKHVNESLGHAAGDQLIQEMAGRLRRVLKDRDTISRLGGDEFAILLVECNSASLVAYVAQRLIEEASKPFAVAGQDLTVSASIGISICPDDGADMAVLLKNADMAMYHVKASGRSGYHFFTPELNQRAQERLTLENNLRKGLQRDEFRLRYQPQVDATGHCQLVGFEALIRWHHPQLGMVSPARFIPVAEDSNLIIPLGEWVLREACRQNKAWQDEGRAPVVMAVNISAVQFRQKNFTEMVSQVLADTGLAPQFLELEITESIIMSDSEKVIEILGELKRIGVMLSIDDFGTGYSSLSYLKRFPIDKIKIDQSFVRDISSDSDDAAIVEAILAIAGKLGMKAIAEGVETEEQLHFLQLRECDEVQGYYFSPPVEPAKAVAFFGGGKLGSPSG